MRAAVKNIWLESIMLKWAMIIIISLMGYEGMVTESVAEPALPRELKGISLGISYEALKERLKELRYKITNDNAGVDTATGIPHRFVVVKSPIKEFRVFIYRFYEGKLLSIKAEYNVAEVGIDFNQLFSALKEKYCEPVRIEDKSADIFGVKFFIYYWEDDQTQLKVGYGPPGRDPILKRPDQGAISWEIFDKALLQAYEEELLRRDPPFMRNQQEKEQRLKELRERAENPVQDTAQDPKTDSNPP
jgi:hypothetical protein